MSTHAHRALGSSREPSGAHPHAARTGVYRRRRPETTALYRVVQTHFETWLVERSACESIPRYVEEDFRRYLDCGILARGFCRAFCAACGHDFLVAFSCKARGVCPSCNTRRMAETAAHLVEHVFPQVPVRQWVISFPKRLRYFLHRDMTLTGRVLRVWLRVVEAQLLACCPGAPGEARFGAVSFIQRFGSSLNAHTHIHACIIDGVFSQNPDSTLRFHPATTLTASDIAALETTTRSRVLRLFQREGLLSGDTVEQMRAWDHAGGFSLDASVRIGARDRAGLERLLRYCATPPLAGGRLSWQYDTAAEPRADPIPPVVYQLPKPDRGGQTLITPLELLDRLAMLIPPPRKHRHRYHGVLAPNSALRRAVSARAGLPIDVAGDAKAVETSPPPSPEPGLGRRTTSLWAFLISRIYEAFPLACPRCEHVMVLIAFITEPAPIKAILNHLDLPATPPPIAHARGPPLHDEDQTPDFDPTAPETGPKYEFDQTVSW